MKPKGKRVRTISADSTFKCESCSKVFRYKRNFEKHIDLCQKMLKCQFCDRKFVTDEQRQQHIATSHNAPPFKANVCCSQCKDTFANRKELYVHQGVQHGGGADEELHNAPWGDHPPWVGEEGEIIDAPLEKVFKANRKHILASHQDGDISAIYNFPTNNLEDGVNEFEKHLQAIYEKEQESFKVNVAFGLILSHVETGEYRYFIPYKNSTLFTSPMQVSSHRNLAEIRERLGGADIEGFFTMNRPNTKWKAVMIVNINYFVARTGYPLGRGFLPEYLKRSHSVIGLDTYPNGEAIADCLCAFRCLAHRFSQRDIEASSKVYYQRWRDYVFQHLRKELPKEPEKYSGLQVSMLSEFERCFKLSVYVYEMMPDKTVILRYKPSTNFPQIMYLNLYQNHLSYISKFRSYAKKFQCPVCGKCHTRFYNYKRHISTCSRRTSYIYKGGYYANKLTIFERLEQVGIKVTEDKQYYEYFAVFDCESLLEKANPSQAEKLQWIHCHKPISVSVCSNVPGYEEAECIVEENQQEFVRLLIVRLHEIQAKAETLMKTKWSEALSALQALKQKWKDIAEKQCKEHSDSNEGTEEINDSDGIEQISHDEGEEIWDDEVEVEEDWTGGEQEEREKRMQNRSNRSFKMYKMLVKLQIDFESYVRVLTTVGFNSAKYDLNLLKMNILQQLNLDSPETFVIKRNNAYVSISTENLKFLDVSQFLAPGVSYAGFLTAFNVPEKKGFFCYEYLDSAEKLNENCLPPHETFYSSLKDSNISDDEYAEIQEIWRRENMHTLRDYLIYYNNLDVAPFVEGVKSLQKFYFDRKLDVFKISVSVPGIARRMLFAEGEKNGAHFPIMGGEDEDLYLTIKKNIVGGPSIVFCRRHKKDETMIRNGPEYSKQTIGLDSNSLYLSTFKNPMPSESYVRRREENGFRPGKHTRHQLMYVWLEWESKVRNQKVIHALNNGGKEVRIGPYLVDGIIPDMKLVMEFYGCYYHSHFCMKDKMCEKDRIQKLKRTQERENFIREQGFEVISMWECQFLSEMESCQELTEFSQRFFPEFYRSHPGSVKPEAILDAVKSGKFFGLVEVDIEVPETWPDHFQREIDPRSYYSEMCPLFCTVNVKIEDIGEHMQHHVALHGLSTKPRKLLVSGLKAKKILLLSSLQQWYLQHGLMVTWVYQAVEFVPKACFVSFTEAVTKARREGDNDSQQTVLADTMKLIGNSAYGGIIMQKERQHQVKYFRKRQHAVMAINSPRFRKVSEMDGEFFEIESVKSRIYLDTAVYLGFSVLNLAKLRVLEFYYQCLDEIVERKDFQMVQMDTDSFYLTLSRETLGEVVMPNKKYVYNSWLYERCDDGLEPLWFMRDCCDKHRKYDRRAPAIFKEEARGNEIIALSSKTYVLKQTDGCKLSCKGINKKSVKNPIDIYSEVLQTGNSEEGQNRGMRAKDNTIFSYTQRRTGFSYLYCKCKVMNDSVTTVPLDITLSPWEIPEQYVFGFAWDPLSPPFPWTLVFERYTFISAEHLFLYRFASFHADEVVSQAIKISTAPEEIRVLASLVKPSDRWREEKRDVMLEVLLVKMRSQPNVRNCLKHNLPFVYAHPKDYYLGVGMSKQVASISTPEEFRGRNVLGELWSEVREVYRCEYREEL